MPTDILEDYNNDKSSGPQDLFADYSPHELGQVTTSDKYVEPSFLRELGKNTFAAGAGAANQVAQGLTGIASKFHDAMAPVSQDIDARIKAHGMNTPSDFQGYGPQISKASQDLANQEYAKHPAAELAGAIGANVIPSIPPSINAVKAVGNAVASSSLARGVTGGIGQIFSNTDNIAKLATEKTLQAIGGDFSKATPQDFLKSVYQLKDQVSTQKENYYAARDKIADDNNVMVNRQPLADKINEWKAISKKGLTPSEKIALQKGTTLLGDGSDLSYRRTQDQINDLSKLSYSLRIKNPALSDKYSDLKTALQQSVDQATATAHPELQAAHQTAQDYYHNTYAPLRDFIDKNSDGSIPDEYSHQSFLANIIKSIKNTKTGADSRALLNNAVTPDQQTMLRVASLRALHDYSNQEGHFDLPTYLRKLSGSLENDKALWGDKINDIQTLADAMEAHRVFKFDTPSKGDFVKSGIAFAIGNSIGGPLGGAIATGASIAPKATSLYGAGKMLNDPGVAKLLGIIRETKDANPAVAKSVTQMVGKRFDKYMEPMKILSRSVPVANIGQEQFNNTQSQPQETNSSQSVDQSSSY